MKKLREICAAAALLIILSLPAIGGNIHTDAVPPPPPPPPLSAMATEMGEPSGGSADGGLVSDTLLTEIIVSTLQLLSVF